MTSSHPVAHLNRLGLENVAKSFVFVEEDRLPVDRLDNGRFVSDLKDIIVKSKHPPLIRLDMNPYPLDFYLTELPNQIDPEDFFMLIWDASNQDRLPKNAAYWPSCFYHQRLAYYPHQLRRRTGRVSFLSGTARWHRIFLLQSLKHKFCTVRDVVAVNKKSQSLYLNPYDINHVAAISSVHWLNDLPWATKQCYLDQPQDLEVINNLDSADHPAFDCCINITGETMSRGPAIFITEKTWKPLRSGCLLLNYGCDATPWYLQSLGFQLLEADVVSSLEEKIEIISQLLDQDIEKIYHDNLEIIYHNIDRFWSDDLFENIARGSIEKLKNFISC